MTERLKPKDSKIRSRCWLVLEEHTEVLLMAIKRGRSFEEVSTASAIRSPTVENHAWFRHKKTRDVITILKGVNGKFFITSSPGSVNYVVKKLGFEPPDAKGRDLTE